MQWREEHIDGKFLLKFLTVGVFIDTMATGMLTPLLPNLASHFGLSQSFITALLTLRGATCILCSGFVSFLIPILGFRSMIFLTLAGTIISSAILATMPTWHLLGLALVLQGMCSESTWAAGLTLAAQMFGRVGSSLKEDNDDSSTVLLHPTNPSETSGMVGAVGSLLSVSSIGYLMGPFVGAVVYQYTTPWMPFTLVGAFCAIVLLVFVAFSSNEGVPRGAPSLEPIPDEFGSDTMLISRAFAIMGTNKVMLAVLSVVLCTSASMGAEEVMLPFHLTDSCGFPVSQVGVVFAVGALTYGAVAAMAEELVKVISPMWCIYGGVVGQAIFCPFVFLPRRSCNIWYQVGLAAAYGGSIAINATPVFPRMIDELNRLQFGSYSVAISLYNSVYTIGLSAGPLAAASLLTIMDPFSIMVMVNVLVLLCVPLLYWSYQS